MQKCCDVHVIYTVPFAGILAAGGSPRAAMLAAFVSVIFEGMIGVPSALGWGNYREHLAFPFLPLVTL